MNKKILVIGLIGAVAAIITYKKIYKKGIKESKSTEKVLHVEANRAITTLDPTMAEDLTSTIEICKVYEGLLEYHYLKRPAELIPNLAESMPEVSEDGLVYTFKIKKGIFFQDNKCFSEGKGRELKAQDFVYSIKRFADPKVNAPYFCMLDGRIKGLNDWRERNAKNEKVDYDDVVEGIRALDDYTLQIKLSQPWPQFLYMICMPFCYAIPKDAVDFYGKEFMNHPVGTGPYIIENYNSQDNKVVAVKNPNFREKYYPTDASDECKQMLIGEGRRLPFLDKIVTYVIVEDQTKWLQFMKADLDILNLEGCSDVGKKIDGDKPVEDLVQKGIKLVKRPFAHTSMYCINCSDPILKNIYLRQAISLAYDRKKENDLFNDGIYTVAQSIIPPNLKGYDSGFVNHYVQCNIEEAKKMLAKAGYPEGKGLEPINLDIKQSSIERQQAEYFQKCMETIGIKIIISVNSQPELIKKMQTKQVQIFKLQWYGDYPDAENYLALFHNTQLFGGIYTYYSNKEFDKLYVKANNSKSSDDRESLYKRMNEIIAHDLPMLPQVHNSKLLMHYDYVLNFDYLDSKFNIFEYVDIDMDKKNGDLAK